MQALTKALTYSGLLPFILLSCCGLLQIDKLFGITILDIFISYGAVILSFIAGIHFAYAIMQHKLNTLLLILSNIIALLCVLCLFLEHSLALFFLMLGYLVNMWIDFIAYQHCITDKWFLNLRLRVSLIVMVCLLLQFYYTF